MKKVFLSVQLEVVYFDVADIITTSEYATGSGTSTGIGIPTGAPTETEFVPGNGFAGEDLPF